MKYKNIQRLSASLSDLLKDDGLASVVKAELEDDFDNWEVISIETIPQNNGTELFRIWIGEIES
jgi:hypothetical protein